MSSCRATNAKPLDAATVRALDAAIRTVVVSLRAHGFNTTDSGDGTKSQEGALEFPHVFATIGRGALVHEADRLLYWLIAHATDEGVRRAQIEATYSPVDGVATLALYNVMGGMLVERCLRCMTCRGDVVAHGAASE